MAIKESSTIDQEEKYLYLYNYTADDIPYNWFGYFKNRREAEATILFWNAGVSWIKTVSLDECKRGVKWNGLYIPYRESDWKRMHDQQD